MHDLTNIFKNKKYILVLISLAIIIICIYSVVLDHDKKILQDASAIINEGYEQGATLSETKWGNIEKAKEKLNEVYFSSNQKQALLAVIQEREIGRELGKIQLLLNEGYEQGATLSETKWGNIEKAKEKLNEVYFNSNPKQALLAVIQEREIGRELGQIQLILANSKNLDLVDLTKYKEKLMSYKDSNYKNNIREMLINIDSQIEFIDANNELKNGKYANACSELLAYINKYPTGYKSEEAKELLVMATEKLRMAVKARMEKENPALAEAKELIGDDKVGYKIFEKTTGRKSQFIRVYVSNPTRERIIIALQEMIENRELSGNVLSNEVCFQSKSGGGSTVAEYNYKVSMFGDPEKGTLYFAPKYRGEEINFPKYTYAIW